MGEKRKYTKHSSLINSGGAVGSNLNKHVEYKSERTISKYDVDSNEPSNVDVDEGSSGINHLTNEFEKNYTAKTEKMEQTNHYWMKIYLRISRNQFMIVCTINSLPRKVAKINWMENL